MLYIKIRGMKYKKELVEALKNKILASVDEHPNDLAQYSIENLSISKATALKYIDVLIKEKKLIRVGLGRYPSYSLPVTSKSFSFKITKDSSEEKIAVAARSFVGELPYSASQIFDYAFMEITNNAIEHSSAKTIKITIEKSATKIRAAIYDDGIGIFKKIKNDLGLQNESQALIELSKGKFTSSPQNHSGEGIFFSSKLCDAFYIDSDGLVFSPQAKEPEFIKKSRPKNGTMVVLTILIDTKKVPKKIFDEFAGSDFDAPKFKTVAQLRFMQQEGLALTSRSQARRLLARMEKFTSVTFDFEGVDFIGQAFADEIFRVYAKSHPNIKFEIANAASGIKTMISHVKNAEN